MALKRRSITYDIDVFADSGNVFPKKCNGIMFRNTGDVAATINGIPILPGEKNDDFLHNLPGDEITNTFQLVFDVSTSGTNKSVTVVRKMLIEIEEPCKPVKK